VRFAVVLVLVLDGDIVFGERASSPRLARD